MEPDRRADAPRVHPETAAEWEAWLAEHHDDPTPGCWLVQWRPGTGRPAIPYEPLIEVALAHGWIDGTRTTVDAERTEMWFTRRRAGSQWTRLSKERVARLEAAGRLTDAGRAVVDRAKADGTWSLLDDAENLVVPPDLSTALDGAPGAREGWDAFTPGVRRSLLIWIAHAKRPQTRSARIVRTAAGAAVGEPANRP